MERRTGVTHALSECMDCGRTWSNHKNALACGAAHAKATGHEVACEQMVSVRYNPKER